MVLKLFKGILRRLIYLTIIMGILGIANYHFISWYTSDANTYDVNKVPKKKVALVLGTSQFLRNGSTNLYFKFRIDAVMDLWKKGKVQYILVSGDNGRKEYDEPTAMRDALIKRGVPSNRIVLDYAGFRTLDSMVRAKKVFGQHDLLIVSQQFHVERALIIAAFSDIEAFGYNAVDVEVYSGFRTIVREYLARIKLWIDFVFGVDPKYLGEPVEIGS